MFRNLHELKEKNRHLTSSSNSGGTGAMAGCSTTSPGSGGEPVGGSDEATQPVQPATSLLESSQPASFAEPRLVGRVDGPKVWVGAEVVHQSAGAMGGEAFSGGGGPAGSSKSGSGVGASLVQPWAWQVAVEAPGRTKGTRRFAYVLKNSSKVIDVLHPGRANVSKAELKGKLAGIYEVKDQNSIFVFKFRTHFGGGKSTGFGPINDNVESVKKYEPKYRLIRNGLATKIEKSRKQMKERKNRTKKIRGTKAGDAAKGGNKK